MFTKKDLKKIAVSLVTSVATRVVLAVLALGVAPWVFFKDWLLGPVIVFRAWLFFLGVVGAAVV